MTKEEVRCWLESGGTVVEEVPGMDRRSTGTTCRLEWGDPAARLFHNTPEKMASHLWERHQWLGTKLSRKESR